MQLRFSRQSGVKQGAVAGVAPVLLVVGVVLLLIGGGFWLHEYARSRTVQHTEGVVIELQASQDGQGNVHYAPRVRFRLPSGELVQFVSGVSGNSPAFQAGEAVPVLYRGDQPQDAEIGTHWRVYKASIITGVLGMVFFDVGFGALWWMRRTPESKTKMKRIVLGR
jgi:hypothetical protein